MPLSTIVLHIVCACTAFVFVRAIYRVRFHPLANSPAPPLAAITSLYAASYDLPLGSSFCKHLPELHVRYGPIVRIRPNELHILDMDSYNKYAYPLDSSQG